QRLICKLADCVLVSAESIKDRLVKDGYAPSQIVVIQNGIDVPQVPPPIDPAIRHELGVSTTAPIVVTVSRLAPMMGVEDFIDAAAILSWQFPDVRFVVVSGETLRDLGMPAESADYRRSIEHRVRR